MRMRSILVVGWMAVVLAGSARGQFVPGHVFAAQGAGKLCSLQAEYGGDKIWEIDPQTGEATVFVEIPEEMCGFLTGLAFTPDGTRLRASSWLRNEILEFDSQGNMTVALDFTDGIACPWGLNNLAYDATGNFYVLNQCTRNILRFPSDGGPPTVFADADDGVDNVDAIAFSADGDLYFVIDFPFREIHRITPEGNASFFDRLDRLNDQLSLTADKSGHIYVGPGSGEIFKYDAGNPASRELLAVLPIGWFHSLAISPDQSIIYVNTISTIGGGTIGRLLGVDVNDGTLTTLADFDDGLLGIPVGMAVVPVIPPPIPTVSQWGVIVMTLLVLTAGTLVLIRRRYNAPPFRLPGGGLLVRIFFFSV